MVKNKMTEFFNVGKKVLIFKIILHFLRISKYIYIFDQNRDKSQKHEVLLLKPFSFKIFKTDTFRNY